ncbi:AraC family transcriptional regulator [Paenibacillus sp. CAU 1782]
MRLNNQIKVWNHAFIKIMDVRMITMQRGERLPDYRFPCSVFLYTIKGQATLSMDEKRYLAGDYRLFHGGKGAKLRVHAMEELQLYMVLYKAVLSPPCPPAIAELAEADNPFQSHYEFGPRYPVKLYERLKDMHTQWNSASELGSLQAKATFQQFIHELLWQLRLQEVEPEPPDRVSQAVRYIHEHYREPVSLTVISSLLDCSEGHLSRLFKTQLGLSPIQYLNKLRIQTARHLLLSSVMTLQEIAEQVGFPDAHSFSRSFRKHTASSPLAFRNNGARNEADQKLPLPISENALLMEQHSLYNDIENHFHHLKGREMYMQKRNKNLAIVMMLAWSLILTACSGAGGGSSVTEAPSSSPSPAASAAESSQASSAAEESAARTISTPRGDVEVPANPQRVASDQYMGHLLKLGIKPVGVKSMMLDEGWFEKAGITEEALSGIADLGGVPMDLEKLTALDPDLILVSIDKELEQYEKIGTTVFLPYWEGESTAGPLDKFRRISDVFGKRDIAEEWIAEYEKKAEAAREKIKGVIKEGETVSVIQFSEKVTYVFGAKGGNYGAPTIYETLQLQPTQSALDMKEGFESVSLEVLPSYLGDHIFVYNGEKEAIKAAMESPIWKLVPAVQNNKVYMYGDAYHDEFLMEDPYSLEQQLDTFTSLLLENNK